MLELIDKGTATESMGCFVVQKYLETRHGPAAVLLAPAAPRGLRRAVLRMFRCHPWTFIRASTFGDSTGLVSTPALARELLFCAQTPEAIVEACAARMAPESARAGTDQMLGRLKPGLVTAPLLSSPTWATT